MRTSAGRWFAVTMLFMVACGKRADLVADSASGGRDTMVVAGKYTLADFQRLRWLEGRWRGFMANGDKFYEQYRFMNDSTIVKYGFPDSTFAKASDSSRVELRGGTVSDESLRSRYVATRLDSTGVDFAPVRGANNQFTWAQESATRWNATLRWTDKDGRPQTVVYALHKFER